MRYDISIHSSEGGKAFAKRLRNDIDFRDKIVASRKERKGTDWIRIAAKKGGDELKKIREKQNDKVRKRLYKKLENEDNLCLLARLCGFISGDGTLEKRIDKNGWARSEVRFYPDSLEVAKIFVDTFRELYEKEASIKELKN